MRDWEKAGYLAEKARLYFGEQNDHSETRACRETEREGDCDKDDRVPLSGAAISRLVHLLEESLRERGRPVSSSNGPL